MFANFLLWLCDVSPRARRLLWRWWYNRWARLVSSAEWTFMNYGFAWPQDTPAPVLPPEDQADRSCAQLYHRVILPGNLRGREVLEVGSGRGGGAAFAMRAHTPARLTGVDFSPVAVAFCQTRHPLPGLSFRTGDAEALPFPEASFDAVINVESSHCYGSMAGFLAEVTRVLRPGGVFLFADLRGAPEMAALEQQLATLPGMEVDGTEDLTGGVAAALESDDQRKEQMIRALVPAGQQPLFREFAGMRGSRIHRSLRDGSLLYRRWVLRRKAEA